MHTIGIIAEYNPFHSGHRHHIQAVRQAFGADCAVVCACLLYTSDAADE